MEECVWTGQIVEEILWRILAVFILCSCIVLESSYGNLTCFAGCFWYLLCYTLRHKHQSSHNTPCPNVCLWYYMVWIWMCIPWWNVCKGPHIWIHNHQNSGNQKYRKMGSRVNVGFETAKRIGRKLDSQINSPLHILEKIHEMACCLVSIFSNASCILGFAFLLVKFWST